MIKSLQTRGDTVGVFDGSDRLDLFRSHVTLVGRLEHRLQEFVKTASVKLNKHAHGFVEMVAVKASRALIY